jgi:hybrid cluster-associated redox disulfide protein
MRRLRNILKRALSRSGSGPKPTHKPQVQSVFTAEMTIDEAWNNHPKAPKVFQQFHLPSCSGCSVRFDEKISEASDAYGIHLEDFLCALNALRR